MNERTSASESMTLIVFSNDLDKATAAFILATGAASTGMQVTMYFTFWGLALLRKKNHEVVKKNLIERLFGLMLPEGPDGTMLSKMHFFGVGTVMMKWIMRKKKMPRLVEMMELAKTLGVRIVACTTSMGMMGFHREELIDGTEIGGVATYLERARRAEVNLFI